MFNKEANTNNLNNRLLCCFGCLVLSLLFDSTPSPSRPSSPSREQNVKHAKILP